MTTKTYNKYLQRKAEIKADIADMKTYDPSTFASQEEVRDYKKHLRWMRAELKEVNQKLTSSYIA